MTSNIATQVLTGMDVSNGKDVGSVARDELRKYFRPEFLNRIDEITVFHALSRDAIMKIVDLQMEKVNERLADRELDLVLSERAREALAEKGYDPDFGARPLKRVIQREILNPLARLLVSGDLAEKGTLLVDFTDGEFTFGES